MIGLACYLRGNTICERDGWGGVRGKEGGELGPPNMEEWLGGGKGVKGVKQPRGDQAESLRLLEK